MVNLEFPSKSYGLQKYLE